MNGSLIFGAIRKLSGLFAVGLLGYYIGLRGSEGESSIGPKEPVATLYSSARSENKENGFASINPQVAKRTPAERDPGPKNVTESKNIEARIQETLSTDESVVAQESERIPDAEAVDGSAERIRMLPQDKQLKYVQALAENQDDASIAELKELVTFDSETVRHAAVDTLIKIMDQETGHYGAVEAVLADNAVFLDEGQMAKFNKISSRVVKRSAKENPAPAF